jgi:fatty acid desaturase
VKVEWPTVFLIIIHWLAFCTLTLSYQHLQWWIILPLGGFLIALFGSLQHEVLHGHPTPKQWLNEALIFPNIALWMPYAIYKSTHLTHHINDQLTDPALDPESYYLCPIKWQNTSSWAKAYFRFYNTFIGRVVWGPIHAMLAFWASEMHLITRGDWQRIRCWGIHLLSCLPVCYWVLAVCDIPFWAYVALFVYPGVSLTMLRSFIEHQAVEKTKERSIIVETNAIMSLMFLNNNLHAVHHQHPKLAWFKIPQIWQSDRSAVLQANGNYYFAGYLSIIYRYWRTPKEQPNHPL